MSTVKTRSRWAASGALTGLLVASSTLAACGSKPASLKGAVVTPAPNVAGVTLPDVAHDGELFTMRAAAQGLLVVYFGYTNCPDLCPTTLSNIAVALRKIGSAKAQRVSVAMATVDPGRDTPVVLTGYLDHFFATSHALRTTNQQQLADAAAAFGVEYQVATHKPGETDYSVAHTAFSYVVDDRGRVVDEWPFGLKPADMASDLKLLLKEEKT